MPVGPRLTELSCRPDPQGDGEDGERGEGPGGRGVVRGWRRQGQGGEAGPAWPREVFPQKNSKMVPSVPQPAPAVLGLPSGGLMLRPG